MLNYLDFRAACDVTFGVFLVQWFFLRHVAYLIVCYSVAVDLPFYTPYGCYSSATGKRVSNNGGSAVLANVLQPFNDPNGLVCFNNNIRYGFLSLLLALQILTIIWFGMILRVAYGVLSGKAAQDSRSDDEASDFADNDDYDESEVEDETDVLEQGEHHAAALPVKQEMFGDLHADETASDENKNVNVRPGSPPASGSSSSGGGGSGSRGRRTRGAARTSGISIPGHGDRKELLGRIGCDKPS
jgi:very-long-chain ceramide synthase